EESGGQARKLSIEARAYDDAVAFRYLVPEQNVLRSVRLTKEATEFRIAKDATTYSLLLPNFHSMYESEYVKLPISAFSNQGGVASKVLIGLPTLMEVPGVGWMAIAEADLRGNSSMYLTNPSASWLGHWFESVLSPSDDEPDVITKSSLPYHSAWRVLLVGDGPGRLVESNVITSLNPESEIADTSWIHAGRATWDWWNGSLNAEGKSAFTTDTMKYYVDFAAKSGFEYMLVDAGWSEPKDSMKMNGKVDIPELVKYAAGKGVKIWIWLYYGAVDSQMEESFPLYEKWGVAGMKIDFIERDDQRGVNFYYRVAKAAAEHHLMVDFHGSTKPSGLERTFPNVLGYEAVLGMEQSKAGMRDNPDHHATLPFTRMLAGPMDYTPGAFRNATREAFEPRMESPMVMGTRAQQLAMYVVYQAAFQMVADSPQSYVGQPEFQFIRDTPATWDETLVLGGTPGEFATIARRHGKEWFLGSLTSWHARQLDLPLDFLGDGKFTAEIYADADDAAQHPTKVRMERKVVERSQHLPANLAPGGGYAVRFVPAP
ncbi:MAG TPA: glycoside hydrolase family 97 catalytic domain-containing protein, partial [Terriglobales bacterium]|nr:glycoside hydrolase family 97 catalytic domain-containing protein [Terriglobales bacterium]